MLSIAAKQVSPALHISLAIPYAALPVSGMLIIIHELENSMICLENLQLIIHRRGG